MSCINPLLLHGETPLRGDAGPRCDIFVPADIMAARLAIDTPYWFFVIGILVFGAGMGLAGTPATTVVTGALPMSKQGVASAMNDAAREVGSAFGIAILGAVLNQSYRAAMAPSVAGLPPAVADRVLSSVAFTGSPAVQQLGAAGQVLVDHAREAFVGGVSDAVFVGCLVLGVAAVLVFVIAGPEKEA